jgi:hypothetical protein
LDGFRKIIIAGDRYSLGYNENGILMVALGHAAEESKYRHNIQMYFCRDCGRQFQGGQRINNFLCGMTLLSRSEPFQNEPNAVG